MTDFSAHYGLDFDPEHPVAECAAELVAVFARHGYTADGIAGHLGPDGYDAVLRGEPGAVQAYLADPHQPLSVLIRAFILHQQIPATQLADILGAGLLSRLLDARVARSDEHGRVDIVLDIRPHIIVGENYWIFSDVDASLVAHIPGSEHVLGVGAASLSLLHSTPLSPVATALDLGTGSGVQILGQLASATEVTATDIHPRALALAAATVAGAGAQARVELLAGSWFEPVAGRRFDRIVANPPFVVAPPRVDHIYRDSGLALDGATELVLTQAWQHLTVGGTAHILGSWVHSPQHSWQQRVASWLPDTGVAAWIIQRDSVDPAHYIGTWLRDESLDPRSREAQDKTTHWLEYFRSSGITKIGMGFVALQRLSDDEPSDILAEDIPQHFSDPLGPEVEEYFRRIAWLRDRTPEQLAHSRYALRAGLAREHIDQALPADHLPPGAGDFFSPVVIRLTRTDGPRFSHEVDTTLAQLCAGLHPQGLSLAETVELYAAAHDLDAAVLLEAALPAIVDLVRHGMIIPAELLDQDHS